MAEKAVQTAKNLLKKAVSDNKDPFLSLISLWAGDPSWSNKEYRYTLNRPSPAQRLMDEELAKNSYIKKFYYDRYAKPFENLVVGDSVMMQVKIHSKPAKITAVTQNILRS